MKLFGIEVRAVPSVAPKSAAEVWVTKDGRRMTIGEMEESHAKHSLALIMRNIRAGRFMTTDEDDKIAFFTPATLLQALASVGQHGSDWERGEVERELLRAADERFDLMSPVDPFGQDSCFHDFRK